MHFAWLTHTPRVLFPLFLSPLFSCSAFHTHTRTSWEWRETKLCTKGNRAKTKQAKEFNASLTPQLFVLHSLLSLSFSLSLFVWRMNRNHLRLSILSLQTGFAIWHGHSTKGASVPSPNIKEEMSKCEFASPKLRHSRWHTWSRGCFDDLFVGLVTRYLSLRCTLTLAYFSLFLSWSNIDVSKLSFYLYSAMT